MTGKSKRILETSRNGLWVTVGSEITFVCLIELQEIMKQIAKQTAEGSTDYIPFSLTGEM